MEEWSLHQKSWMYLEPIIGSSYALKNLNRENKIFQQADALWKKLMR
jgi:dynein heavy chain